MKLFVALYLGLAVFAHENDNKKAEGCSERTRKPWLTTLPAALPPPPPLVTIPVSYQRMKSRGTKDDLLPSFFKERAYTQIGLIQVNLPQRAPILAPGTMAARQEYAVARPRMGKVIDQTPPTYFCKRPGFVLEEQMCVQTLVEPPTFVCPGGFEAAGGECVRKVRYMSTCPTGWTQKDGDCVKIVTADYVKICPPDSVQTADDVCEREAPHPLSPRCEEGRYDGLTGNCVVQATEEPRGYCPEGFTFVDGVCLREEVYDCTDRMDPPSRRQLTLRKNCTPTPCLGHPTICAKLALPCAPAPPAVVSLAQPTVQRTQTTVLVRKTCTRVTSTALILSCDDGVLQSNQCWTTRHIAPVPTCTALGDINRCYTKQRVPPLLECPTDFNKECTTPRICRCVSQQIAASAQSCPSGYDPTPDGCQRVSYSRPQCSAGYFLQSDTCVRILREPADCTFSVTYECDKDKGVCGST